jgi:catechol 2,3-dioxygenase-like lactoylglutathione lyase family enzyme
MRLSHRFVMFAALFLVPAPVPSPSLAGIAHLAFRVTDLSRSREFYQTLGFVEAFEFRDPGKPPVSYVKINDRQFIELYGGVDDAHPPGLMHICYEVRDIQSLVQDYATRGLDPPAARKARAGNMLLLLHDTEGRMVEFTEYLPGSLHFEDRGKHLGKQPIARHLVEAGFSVDDVLCRVLFIRENLHLRKLPTRIMPSRFACPVIRWKELNWWLRSHSLSPEWYSKRQTFRAVRRIAS